jgi:hypothetical protein
MLKSPPPAPADSSDIEAVAAQSERLLAQMEAALKAVDTAACAEQLLTRYRTDYFYLFKLIAGLIAWLQRWPELVSGMIGYSGVSVYARLWLHVMGQFLSLLAVLRLCGAETKEQYAQHLAVVLDDAGGWQGL